MCSLCALSLHGMSQSVKTKLRLHDQVTSERYTYAGLCMREWYGTCMTFTWYTLGGIVCTVIWSCSWSSGLNLVLQLGLGLGLGTRNGYFIPFFFPYLKVTNTFVLPSWPGGLVRLLLSNCACEAVGMTQETHDDCTAQTIGCLQYRKRRKAGWGHGNKASCHVKAKKNGTFATTHFCV